MDYTERIIIPLLAIIGKNIQEAESIIKSSGVIREALAVGYEKFKHDSGTLEDLPKEKKYDLWNKSKGCIDRHEYCKALFFYESVY